LHWDQFHGRHLDIHDTGNSTRIMSFKGEFTTETELKQHYCNIFFLCQFSFGTIIDITAGDVGLVSLMLALPDIVVAAVEHPSIHYVLIIDSCPLNTMNASFSPVKGPFCPRFLHPASLHLFNQTPFSAGYHNQLKNVFWIVHCSPYLF